MDETLQTEFEGVSGKVKESFERQNVLNYLSSMRDAVAELRQGGMMAELDVRPRMQDCAIAPKEGYILANGTIKVDDMKLDFVIEGKKGNELYLRVFVGDAPVMQHWSYVNGEHKWMNGTISDYPDAKTGIRDTILRMKSENDLVNSFDTVQVTDVTTDSKVTISAPLKLRRNAAP